MRKRLLTGLLTIVLAICVCACDEDDTPSNGQSPDGNTIAGKASIEGTDILLLESFPIQVRVVVWGNLPDSCTSIDGIATERDGNTFLITITTSRPADKVCAQALVPFEENIALDVLGLPAGVYIFDVNGVRDTFEFTVDNAIAKPLPEIKP